MSTPIADALREARKAAGLMQKDVAAALGISAPYYCDIELGRKDLGEHRLASLPESMRKAVAKAVIEQHKEAIRRVRESVG